MRRGRHMIGFVWLMTACSILILVGGCASGPAGSGSGTGSGEGTPMIDTAGSMIFSYELAKPKPVADDTGAMGGTKWKVTSINPKPAKPYSGMTFSFQPDGNLVEITTYPDGTARTETSRYHVVGSTMIVNKRSGDVNARFRVEGSSLIMDTNEYSMLLSRVD